MGSHYWMSLFWRIGRTFATLKEKFGEEGVRGETSWGLSVLDSSGRLKGSFPFSKKKIFEEGTPRSRRRVGRS